MKYCSISGCERPSKGLGYCNLHYQRFHRLGDPLAPVMHMPRGEVTLYYHTVVLKYEGDACLLWPFTTCKGNGWLKVNGKGAIVHSLVCEHFTGPKPTALHEVAHSCGVGLCVNHRHLRWATRAENMADKLIHGTHNRGERHPLSQLTESDVQEIRSLRGSVKQQELATKFGVGQSHICAIQKGRCWSWLEN